VHWLAKFSCNGVNMSAPAELMKYPTHCGTSSAPPRFSLRASRAQNTMETPTPSPAEEPQPELPNEIPPGNPAESPDPAVPENPTPAPTEVPSR